METLIHSNDYAALTVAVGLLEAPTITEKIARYVGTPIELLIKKLPKTAEKTINELVTSALHKAATTALWSLDNAPGKESSTKTNKLLAAASGALGGAFGFATLAIELPISTTIMLRAIADVARSEGFDLTDLNTKQSCIEVFALGGPSSTDDGAETAYYAARGLTTETVLMLSKELAEIAARQVAANAANKMAPAQSGKWLTAIIEKVATRFGIVITEKAAAQAVPIIGAISGAALNTMFTDFYQDMAKGHFIVKRLEAQYGFLIVKEAYEKIASAAIA
ncbi:MAG: EcsC family protein [Marinagarivorans sp.]|nr:EcsC family protein [Marinagarivorans sp.]